MADNTENHSLQRPQRSVSSPTGWIAGVIVVILVIAALWYYGMHRPDVAGTSANTTNTVTTPPPAAPAAPATGTAGSTGTTTTTTPAPAPATNP